VESTGLISEVAIVEPRIAFEELRVAHAVSTAIGQLERILDE
jgi:hypothetical protein